MTKQEEIPITISVPLTDIQELIRLITKIEIPDVTYDEDILVMAQQAIRLNKMNAGAINEILYKWLGNHGN